MKHAVLLALAFALVPLVPSRARAQSAEPPTDCPPGSVGKASGPFAWCEPTVCVNDSTCSANEVCRPVALCVEIGQLADAGKKGEEHLVATQRCGPQGACPQTQVCSEKGRCVSKVAAQKMGLLSPPSPSSSPGLPPAKEPAKACGCRTTGASEDGRLALVMSTLVLGLTLGRRRWIGGGPDHASEPPAGSRDGSRK